MNINAAFPSKHVKAADLNGQSVPVQIARVVVEDVGDDGDTKPVVYFNNQKKGLVLNKTNALTISGLYSEETNNWTGQWITIYPDRTTYQGKYVDCIRIRETAPTSQVVAPAPPPQPVVPTVTGGVSF